jgi:hypothetical protein
VDACERWDLTYISDEAALAVSELVTNAVLHARTHIGVSLCVAGGKVELAVRDDDPRPPILRPVRTDLLADLDALAAMPANGAQRPPQQSSGGHERIDERHPSLHVGRSGSVAAGRGLLIVDALADEWGVAERADGKEVWLTMACAGWSHREQCECDHTHEHSASGMPVHHQAGPWDLD